MRATAYQDQLLGLEGLDHYDYLTEDRGLSPEAIEHFRLGAVLDPDDSDRKMADRISIPYITPTGVVQMKFRSPPWMGDVGGMKYLYAAGCQTTIFNTRAFLDHGRWICICEGEFDCIAAWMAGVPAVGIPGVKNWKPHYAPLFEGYERVYILADNDPSKVDDEGKEMGQQGLRFAESLTDILPTAITVLMPEVGQDVNSLIAQEGPKALRELIHLD